MRVAHDPLTGSIGRNLGDYASAATLLEQAIAARSAGADSQLALADSLFQLGAIAADRGKPDAAVAVLRQALSIRTRLLGEHDLLVADTLEELAYNGATRSPSRKPRPTCAARSRSVAVTRTLFS